MEIVVGWLFFSVLVGIFASNRGRSGIGWFLLAALFSPLLMFLLVLVLQNNAQTPVSVTMNGEVATPETHVRCPECRELVRADARKCKHCGVALVPQKLNH
jgi:uncharacterized paraquat-inducible protein A